LRLRRRRNDQNKKQEGSELLLPDLPLGGDNSSPVCEIGTVVRLLPPEHKEAAYRHHIGKVVSFDKGTVGVSVHGVLWPEARVRSRQHMLKVPLSEVLPIHRLPEAGVGGSRPVMIEGGRFDTLFVVALMGARGWGLQDGIAEAVAAYLTFCPIGDCDVSISDCSSTRGDFPLEEALTSDGRTWWISEAGSMSRGVGEEWLQFSFPGVRRVSFIGIKIPPLPQGPLSVREFHLLTRAQDPRGAALSHDDKDAWVRGSSGSLQTLNTGSLQELAILPPVDTTAIRLVCTRTAAAASGMMAAMGRVDCVGLFQVRFA